MSDALFNNNFFNRITDVLPFGVRRFLSLFYCAALLISSAFSAGSSEAVHPETSTGTGAYSEAASSAAHPAAPAVIRENLVQNGSFTPSSGQGSAAGAFDAAPWKAGTFGSYTLPKTSAVTGDAGAAAPYILMTAHDDSSRGWIEQSIPVTSGSEYIVSAYIKAENVTYARGGIQILEYTGNSTAPLTTDIKQTLKIKIKTPSHDWQVYRGSYIPAAGVSRITLRLYLGTHAPVTKGAALSFHSVQFMEKPEEAVRSGSVPPAEKSAALADTAAGGTAGDNTASQTAAGNHTQETARYAVNLLRNASFEEAVSSANRLWQGGRAPEGWQLWVPQSGSGLQLSLDRTAAQSGWQSFKITADGQSRLAVHSTYPVDPAKIYRLSMQVKTEAVMGKGIYFRVQYSQDGKKFAVPKDFTGSIPAIGTQDWTEQEAMLTSLPAGTTYLKVELFYDSSVGTAWIDSVCLSESYQFALKENHIKQKTGKKITLYPVFPAGMAPRPVSWTSSNPDCAAVEPAESDGTTDTVEKAGTSCTVRLLQTGGAIITARTIDGNTARCKISIEDKSLHKQYEEIRTRWAHRMTMPAGADTDDSDYQEVVEQLTAAATIRWEDMIRNPNRDELWGKYGSGYISEHLTQTLTDLRFMARAFAAKDSRLYHNRRLKNDILDALRWFYINRYHEGIEPSAMYGNWWDWCIGAPQKLCDILILMYDYISTKDMNRYLTAIRYFSIQPDQVLKGPNPLTGANLLDCATVCALTGALEENTLRLTEARDAISKRLPYVTRGDGFYEDGSFIQHTVFPYTGSYGAVTLAGIENMLYILHGTPWRIEDPNIAHVFEWVQTAFQPLFHKTAIMDMVSGRSIARKNASDHSRGKALLARILALAALTDDPVIKMNIRSFVKANIMGDTLYFSDPRYNETYFTAMNPNDAISFKQLLKDESVKPQQPVPLTHIYAGMDRVVFRQKKYTLGISMHSSRTGAFEIGNGENKRAWHTSDGWISLYNDDQLQYADNYWATVDHHRLSGTTTDHSERTNKSWALNTSAKRWVGGVSLHGIYGVAGMEYEAEKGFSSLTAKKAWFLFDNEIVCLGAGITASDNRPVETIVENRKLRNAGDTYFSVDGVEVLPSFGSVPLHNPRWAFLSANTEDGTDSIGYYFLEGGEYSAARELRTGNWYAVNDHLSEEDLLRNFLSIGIQHGNNPTDAHYAYTLLPCLTEQETEAYSRAPDIQIITNTAAVQAVREQRLGITGCAFWQKGRVVFSADRLQSIEAARPCAVMLQEGSGGRLSLAVCDPTQLQSAVQITLIGGNYRAASANERTVGAAAQSAELHTRQAAAGVSTGKMGSVTVLAENGITRIAVNTEKSYGKSFTVELEPAE